MTIYKVSILYPNGTISTVQHPNKEAAIEDMVSCALSHKRMPEEVYFINIWLDISVSES